MSDELEEWLKKRGGTEVKPTSPADAVTKDDPQEQESAGDAVLDWLKQRQKRAEQERGIGQFGYGSVQPDWHRRVPEHFFGARYERTPLKMPTEYIGVRELLGVDHTLGGRAWAYTDADGERRDLSPEQAQAIYDWGVRRGAVQADDAPLGEAFSPQPAMVDMALLRGGHVPTYDELESGTRAGTQFEEEAQDSLTAENKLNQRVNALMRDLFHAHYERGRNQYDGSEKGGGRALPDERGMGALTLRPHRRSGTRMGRAIGAAGHEQVSIPPSSVYVIQEGIRALRDDLDQRGLTEEAFTENFLRFQAGDKEADEQLAHLFVRYAQQIYRVAEANEDVIYQEKAKWLESWVLRGIHLTVTGATQVGSAGIVNLNWIDELNALTPERKDRAARAFREQASFAEKLGSEVIETLPFLVGVHALSSRITQGMVKAGLSQATASYWGSVLGMGTYGMLNGSFYDEEGRFDLLKGLGGKGREAFHLSLFGAAMPLARTMGLARGEGAWSAHAKRYAASIGKAATPKVYGFLRALADSTPAYARGMFAEAVGMTLASNFATIADDLIFSTEQDRLKRALAGESLINEETLAHGLGMGLMFGAHGTWKMMRTRVYGAGNEFMPPVLREGVVRAEALARAVDRIDAETAKRIRETMRQRKTLTEEDGIRFLEEALESRKAKDGDLNDVEIPLEMIFSEGRVDWFTQRVKELTDGGMAQGDAVVRATKEVKELPVRVTGDRAHIEGPYRPTGRVRPAGTDLERYERAIYVEEPDGNIRLYERGPGHQRGPEIRMLSPKEVEVWRSFDELPRDERATRRSEFRNRLGRHAEAEADTRAVPDIEAQEATLFAEREGYATITSQRWKDGSESVLAVDQEGQLRLLTLSEKEVRHQRHARINDLANESMVLLASRHFDVRMPDDDIITPDGKRLNWKYGPEPGEDISGYTLENLRDALTKYTNMVDRQVDAVMTMVENAARAWGERTGEPVEEFVARNIRGVGAGTHPGAHDLFQEVYKRDLGGARIEIIPTGKRGEVLVDDVYAGIYRAMREKLGDENWLKLYQKDPANAERVINVLTRRLLEDVIDHVQWGKVNGFGWYDQMMKLERLNLGKIFPELLPENDTQVTVKIDGKDRTFDVTWNTFLLVQTVTSFGNEPKTNFNAAVRVWEAWGDRTGPMPMRQESGIGWTYRAEPVEKGIARLNRMREAMGSWDEVIRWMLTEHPASEIYKWNADPKIITRSDPGLHPGAYVMGMKGGPFYLNQNQIDDYTADQWVARANNRRLGQSYRETGEFLESPEGRIQRTLWKEAARRAAEIYGVTMRDLQAADWYHEHELVAEFGAKPPEAQDYAQAAQELVRSRGLEPVRSRDIGEVDISGTERATGAVASREHRWARAREEVATGAEALRAAAAGRVPKPEPKRAALADRALGDFLTEEEFQAGLGRASGDRRGQQLGRGRVRQSYDELVAQGQADWEAFRSVIAQALAEGEGGATIAKDGTLVTSGIIVTTDARRGRVLDPRTMSEAEAEAAFREFYEDTIQHVLKPGHHRGVWLDKESGTFYLDAVAQFDGARAAFEAAEVGRRESQHALYEFIDPKSGRDIGITERMQYVEVGEGKYEWRLDDGTVVGTTQFEAKARTREVRADFEKSFARQGYVQEALNALARRGAITQAAANRGIARGKLKPGKREKAFEKQREARRKYRPPEGEFDAERAIELLGKESRDLGTGWITPEGRFIPMQGGTHSMQAREIFEKLGMKIFEGKGARERDLVGFMERTNVARVMRVQRDGSFNVEVGGAKLTDAQQRVVARMRPYGVTIASPRLPGGFGRYDRTTGREFARDIVLAQRKVPREILDFIDKLNEPTTKPEHVHHGVVKGLTRFLNRGGFEVYFTEHADATTAIHELLGHVFVWTLPEASRQRLAKTLNAKSADPLEWTTHQHETLARMMERYVADGRAPTTELRDAFAVLSASVRDTYESIKTLPRVPKQVRKVFDDLFRNKPIAVSAEEARVLLEGNRAEADAAIYDYFQKDVKRPSPTKLNSLFAGLDEGPGTLRMLARSWGFVHDKLLGREGITDLVDAPLRKLKVPKRLAGLGRGALTYGVLKPTGWVASFLTSAARAIFGKPPVNVGAAVSNLIKNGITDPFKIAMEVQAQIADAEAAKSAAQWVAFKYIQRMGTGPDGKPLDPVRNEVLVRFFTGEDVAAVGKVTRAHIENAIGREQAEAAVRLRDLITAGQYEMVRLGHMTENTRGRWSRVEDGQTVSEWLPRIYEEKEFKAAFGLLDILARRLRNEPEPEGKGGKRGYKVEQVHRRLDGYWVDFRYGGGRTQSKPFKTLEEAKAYQARLRETESLRKKAPRNVNIYWLKDGGALVTWQSGSGPTQRETFRPRSPKYRGLRNPLHKLRLDAQKFYEGKKESQRLFKERAKLTHTEIIEPLPKEVREALGEVRDAGVLVARALASQAAVKAHLELFQRLGRNERMVAPFGKEVEGWEQMPEGRRGSRYGALNARYVHPKLKKMLVGEFGERDTSLVSVETALRIHDYALSQWKMAKTVANPSTQLRNAISNSLFMEMDGISYFNPGDYEFFTEAAKVLSAKDPESVHGKLHRRLIELRVISSDAVTSELQAMVDEVARVPGKTWGQKLNNWQARFVERLGKGRLMEAGTGALGMMWFYRMADVFPKVSAAMKKIMLKKMSIEDAAREVRLNYPTYETAWTSLITQGKHNRGLRTVTPAFLTFRSEELRIGLRHLSQRPFRFGVFTWVMWNALGRALWAATGLGDDEDLVQANLPPWMRTGPMVLPLPYLSKEGDFGVLNLTNAMPWAQYVTGLHNLFTGDDLMDRLFSGGKRVLNLPLNPFVGIGIQLLSNRNFFTGDEITLPEEAPREYRRKTIRFLVNALMPPLFPAFFGKGTGGYSWNKLMQAFDQSPIDRLGEKKRDLLPTVLDIGTFWKEQHINLDEVQDANVRKALRRMQDTLDTMKGYARDKTLDADYKEKLFDDMGEKLLKRVQEYLIASGNATVEDADELTLEEMWARFPELFELDEKQRAEAEKTPEEIKESRDDFFEMQRKRFGLPEVRRIGEGRGLGRSK
jgi:hypothetical protein